MFPISLTWMYNSILITMKMVVHAKNQIHEQRKAITKFTKMSFKYKQMWKHFHFNYGPNTNRSEIVNRQQQQQFGRKSNQMQSMNNPWKSFHVHIAFGWENSEPNNSLNKKSHNNNNKINFLDRSLVFSRFLCLIRSLQL